jgi:hypothetical protein
MFEGEGEGLAAVPLLPYASTRLGNGIASYYLVRNTIRAFVRS